MRLLLQPWRRFLRSDDGTLVVEAVMAIPLLVWAYLALYTYWDAYRTLTTSQKAAYTIADMISREQQPVNNAYIAGMKSTFDYMTSRDFPTVVRVSSVVYRENEGEMQIEWSRSTDTNRAPQLTTATLQPLVNNIPEMSDGDTVVVVETWLDFQPALNIGLPAETYREFIVTRPRFAPRITLQ